MKKQLFIVILAIITLTNFTFAQDTSVQQNSEKSFAKLDEFIAENELEFDRDSTIIMFFNEERVRLGANFETELWKYLGKDFRKHYWISSFVQYKEYSEGNKPLPELAKKIRSNAQDLFVGADDYELLGMKFTILRDVVVDLYEDNNLALAKIVKQKAERIYKDVAEMGVVGARDEYVTCIYENLENNPGKCKVKKGEGWDDFDFFEDEYSEIPNSGIFNGKALSLPAPEYPKAARAVGSSGEVKVEVVIDETGEVIQAIPLSGHKLLYDAATGGYGSKI